MSLVQHLLELRRRGFRAALAIVGGAVVGWILSDLIWAAMETPVRTLAGDHAAALNYTTITSAFDLRIQIAVTAGIVISSPVWLYQVFAFFVPAMTGRERKFVFGFLGAAVPLFVGGCVAGWLVVPHIVELMGGFAPVGSAMLFEAKGYYEFVLKLVLITGVAFTLPIVVVALNFMGVVRGKTIAHGWRWAVLAITLFTAIATPAADVISMLLLAAPMVLLYIAACAVAIGHDRIGDRRALTQFTSITQEA